MARALEGPAAHPRQPRGHRAPLRGRAGAWSRRIKKHGRADRKAIRDALEEVDVKDSPVGPIKFDDTHQACINMILIEMRGGQLRILEKIPTSPALLN